jgi:hypothetical protein
VARVRRHPLVTAVRVAPLVDRVLDDHQQL